MKSALILMMILVLILSSQNIPSANTVTAENILLDSYTPSLNGWWQTTVANTAAGQTFTTPTTPGQLSQAIFTLSTDVSGASGNIVSRLYAAIGGVPSGPTLAESGPVNINSLPIVPATAETAFTFPTPRFKLSASTQYAIVVVVSPEDLVGAFRISNLGPPVVPTHAGAFVETTDVIPNWISDSGIDAWFKVFGIIESGSGGTTTTEPPPTVPVPPPTVPVPSLPVLPEGTWLIILGAIAAYLFIPRKKGRK